MTTDTRDKGCTLQLDGMVVTADLIGPDAQPWGNRTAFKYRVRIFVPGKNAHETFAWGSQHDYERGDDSHAEELSWMVLDELLSAYWDSEEFFATAMGEDVTEERARRILEIIDYAESIHDQLMANETAIRDANE